MAAVTENSKRVRHPRNFQQQGKRPERQKASCGSGDPPSPGNRLFGEHDRPEREHPSEMDAAHTEHEQHECPTATNAEEAVSHPEGECPASTIPPAPVPDHEADG
jgi:hypothetical protein